MSISDLIGNSTSPPPLCHPLSGLAYNASRHPCRPPCYEASGSEQPQESDARAWRQESQHYLGRLESRKCRQVGCFWHRVSVFLSTSSQVFHDVHRTDLLPIFTFSISCSLVITTARLALLEPAFLYTRVCTIDSLSSSLKLSRSVCLSAFHAPSYEELLTPLDLVPLSDLTMLYYRQSKWAIHSNLTHSRDPKSRSYNTTYVTSASLVCPVPL